MEKVSTIILLILCCFDSFFCRAQSTLTEPAFVTFNCGEEVVNSCFTEDTTADFQLYNLGSQSSLSMTSINESKVSDGGALLASIFVPGLGQILKGYTGTGIMTMIGEGGLATAGILCYVEAQKRLEIMRAHSLLDNEYKTACKEYNELKVGSYIVWGAAVALYMYNLLRAYSLSPESYIAVTPSVINTPQEQTYGLCLSIHL